MSNKAERGGCRFSVRTAEGKPIIEMELFHDTVPRLAEALLDKAMKSRHPMNTEEK